MYHLLLIAVVFVVVTLSAHAFPPAPSYTLYGTVRDQVGQTITSEGVMILLLRGDVEVGRSPVTSGLMLDQNYELSIRLDHNRGGTFLYSERAFSVQAPFNLAVEMNGIRYYPIEVSGNLTTGKGGERVRLDLNLGEDRDGDGLPDVWEAWQLYQAGYLPDESGLWPIRLLSKNGDFDKDGMSDWLEYIAGTFAGDATEKFSLAIKEKQAESVRFEFFVITGKTYTIEKSADMKSWTRAQFNMNESGSGADSWRGDDVGVRSAFSTTAPGEVSQFYRLTVR